MSLNNTASTNVTAQFPRHAQIKQAQKWLRNRATQSTQKSQSEWRGDRHTYQFMRRSARPLSHNCRWGPRPPCSRTVNPDPFRHRKQNLSALTEQRAESIWTDKPNSQPLEDSAPQKWTDLLQEMHINEVRKKTCKITDRLEGPYISQNHLHHFHSQCHHRKISVDHPSLSSFSEGRNTETFMILQGLNS
jgi:hypothetical protein